MSLLSPDPVEWRVSAGLTDYAQAESEMRERALAIGRGEDMREQIWLLEHPPLYTAGTSANEADLLSTQFPVHNVERGGQYTYHGPGQRVGYVMLDLRKRGRDVAAFVRGLEQWVIESLAELGVTAERRCGRVGVWVETPRGEEKIGAIGVRLKKWVSYHGISINVAPDLSHFGGIVPCGISEHGVCSLQSLGVDATMDDLDVILKTKFEAIFAPVV